MRTSLTMVLLFLFVSSAWPQSYYMQVKTKDRAVTSFPVSQIRKITFSGITSVEVRRDLLNAVKTFVLFQNYPNPFNPTTTIEYRLSQAQEVRLNIFNVNGQRIRTVKLSYPEAGTYRTTWDGKDDSGRGVASGVYFYQLKAGQVALSKKMMLLK